MVKLFSLYIDRLFEYCFRIANKPILLLKEIYKYTVMSKLQTSTWRKGEANS